MALNWRCHALIQALLSRGPLKEKEFHAIFAGVSGKNPVKDQQVFNNVLHKINKELAYVQFELRACRNQYDGKVYYSVVNNFADEHSKLGTKYSVPQVAFYKGVIEAIVQDTTSQGCITSIEALNIRLENQVLDLQSSLDSQSRIPHAFKSFSMSQKEKTLSDLINDQWLCNTPDGKIGLGIRSFFDLRSWFRNNDLPSCDVCNEAGVKASVCPNEGCNIRIHHYCLKKKFSKRKGSRNCPGCSTEWDLPDFDEDDANELEQNQMSSQDPPTRKRLRHAKVEAVEAAEDHTETQTQAPSDSVPRKRLRSCRVDARAAQTQNGVQSQAPGSVSRKHPRSCITEAVEVAESSCSSPPARFYNTRRTRQSYHN